MRSLTRALLPPAAAAVVALLALAACEEGAVNNGPRGPTTPLVPMPIGFEAIEMGDQSGVAGERPQVLKLDTQDQWADFWARHKAIVTPQPDLPVVDFSREMVIAAVDQAEPSGGYRFEITGIEEIEGRLVVRVSKAIPGPDCIVTAVITQPFHIVRMAKSDLEIEVEVASETYECG